MWPKISKNHKAPRLRLSDHVVVLFFELLLLRTCPYTGSNAISLAYCALYTAVPLIHVPGFHCQAENVAEAIRYDMTWPLWPCTSNEYTALYRSIIQSRYSSPSMSDHAGYFHRTVSQIAKEHNSLMPYDLLTAVKYFQRDTGQLADSPLDCRRRDLFAGFCRFVREEESYGSESQITLTGRSPCAWMIAWTTKTTCFGHLDSESISLDYYNITILLTLFCVLFCFLSTSNCRRSFNIKLGARQWVGTSLWVWLPELAVCPGRKIFFCFIGLCWSSHVPQTAILEAKNQQMLGWDGHEGSSCKVSFLEAAFGPTSK